MKKVELILDLTETFPIHAIRIAEKISLLENVDSAEVVNDADSVITLKNRIMIILKPDIHPQEIFQLGIDVKIISSVINHFKTE